MTVAQRIDALIRAARLSAEHEAVCPVETDTCVKCDQLTTDQAKACGDLLAMLGLAAR